jgi:N-acetylmuramic acid 6-phosphate etherase
MADTPAGELSITEQDNPNTRDISSRTIPEILALINGEDARVAAAVADEMPQVARAAEGIIGRLEAGGRLFYVGTGTSGRLGVLDASECPPTFGVSADLVQGVIAGGYDACHRAVEASEDDRDAGGRDLAARGLTAADAVVGIAASGRTPYTIGAVTYAREIGAFTAAITCVPGSEITGAVEVAIAPVVGPEVLTGSTRMKAGTAQKLVLNMLSTTAMIRLGYVDGNRMTHMLPRNAKLRARSLRIVQAETQASAEQAREALERAGGELPVAIVMLKTGRSSDEARNALKDARGTIPRAIERLQQPGASR